MSNVKELRQAKALPDERVIALCKRLLDRAESGELRSLVYAGSCTGGTFTTGFDTDDVIESAGLLHMALNAVVAYSRENAETDS